MFGLFKPKPPLSPWEKAWTEQAMTSLLARFGSGAVLDTPTLVPEYAGTPLVSDRASANELLDFLKKWMRVDFPVHLKFFSEADGVDIQAPTSSADSLEIEVHENLFADQNALIAIMSRQLANGLLDDGKTVPWMIDLCPLYFGLGIFSANATLRAKPKPDGLSWWTTKQQGYLPSRMFGYALALRAQMRGESTDDWKSALRQDALAALDDGEAYVGKTGDTIFHRDMLTQPRDGISIEALLDELRKGSPSRKILATWEIQRREETSEAVAHKVADGLLDNLRDKEPELRAVAVSALPRFSKTADVAQDVCDALRDRDETVRIAAASAMGAFVGIDDESMVYELTEALKDDVRLVVFNAAHSLTAFGKVAQPALKSLLKRFRRSLNECRDEDSRTLMVAIDAISEDTLGTLTEYFGEADAEYLKFSAELYNDIHSAP